jgi:uncharacterized protein (DUF58 family)
MSTRSRSLSERPGVAQDVVVGGARLARAVRAILVRWARRIAEVVSPLGWALIALVPVALIIGYRLNWVELLAIGWAAVALVLVALVYLATGTVNSVELEVPHNRVVVGETATGTVTASNARRRRALGVVVEVPVGRGLARIVIPPLPRAAREVREFQVPTARRGVVTVGPARTVTADPIGLVRRESIWSGTTELFVHPVTVALPGVSGGYTRDLEGQTTRDLTPSDLAFHAVREYTPGDERRHIHWRSTAKTGRYMVRQFEETRRSSLVIVLSLDASGFASDREFELAVSATASLGVRAIRDTRDVGVVVSGPHDELRRRSTGTVRSLSTLTRSRLLDDLSTVERQEGATGLSELARAAGTEAVGASVAYLVCGSALPPASIRAAAARFPAGVDVVGIICDADAAPELHRRSGLAIVRIGALGDLRGAVERVRS